MEQPIIVADGDRCKGEPEPDYRQVPRWAVWHLAASGWGLGLMPADRRDGRCAWCRCPGADYRGASFKLCIPCAMLLGYSRPWYVPVCRRCQHPLMPGAVMGVWTSPSEKDARLCAGCAAGWLRVGPDEFCRNLIAGAGDGARMVASLLLERGRDRADVLKAAEGALWANSYLFESLRLGRISVERLVARVHQVAIEIVDDFEKSIDAISSQDRQ